MADEILLNEAAYAVWQTVKEKGPIELGEVVKLTGIDQRKCRRRRRKRRKAVSSI